MVESVGKKLNHARLKRGLTIDEAAHATRLRPDKIAALESDDYSRFANNIYAKGFLQIYARFLDVDVADFARTLDNANPISVSDYQYLSNAPAPRRENLQVRREERKPPSLAPLFFFVFLIAAGLGGTYIYTKFQQIEGKRTDKTTSEKVPAVAEANSIPAAAQASGAAAPTPIPPGSQTLPPGAIATASAASTTPGPVVGAPGKTEPPKSADQDFVTPTAVPTGDPAAHHVPASGVNEVLVATVKKTWVTVRKDDPKALPIFDDYVYPSANPLKLKGARFFIEARDPGSVQITKNGLPYAYQPGGGLVQ